MNPTTIIDYSIGLAYVALVFDMVLQIRRISLRKSAGDISIVGVVVRLLASVAFMVKYVHMGDTLLSAGQAFLLSLMAVYVFLIVSYRITAISAEKKII